MRKLSRGFCLGLSIGLGLATTGAVLALDLTPLPNEIPQCNPGGPYVVECQGETTSLTLDAGGSSDLDGDPLTFAWTVDCPLGVMLLEETSPTPTLTVQNPSTCSVECTLWLSVSDGFETSTCSTTLTIQDTQPPEISYSIVPQEEVGRMLVEFSATDGCGTAEAAAQLNLGDREMEIENGQVLSLSCHELRAVLESSGGDNRLTFSAVDDCGNASSSSSEITLPDGWCEGQPFIRGDSNGTDAIDIADAVFSIHYMFWRVATSAVCQDAIDVNDDGRIDIRDPIHLILFLYRGRSAIPPPFPEPGYDSTPDDLECEIWPPQGLLTKAGSTAGRGN